MAATGTKVEQVSVGGEPGLFVSGQPHVVMFVGRNGQIQDEQGFLAGTVLLCKFPQERSILSEANAAAGIARFGRAGQVDNQ